MLSTILVVDDELLICELFSEILSDNDYRVLTANNGCEALKVLQKEKVDLLLSDVIMPEVNGYELAAKVAELYPEIKIQLMSGNSEARNRHLVPPELHQQLISKPVNLRLLLDRISELLC